MAPKDEDEHENPLGFVDRLLDKERDTNLHFGDVRFWKHLEYINTDQIYRTSSLEYKTMKLMFCEAVFYALFLSCLTMFIVEQRSTNLYESRRQQYDFWASCTRDGDRRSCRMDDVVDADSLMTWLQDDFVHKAFAHRELYPSVVLSPSVFRLQDGVMDWTPRFVGDTSATVLVGTIRIRQQRTQFNQGCSQVSLGGEEFDCFAPYNAGYQSKAPWQSSWTPEHLHQHYQWHGENKTDQIAMDGYHGTYPGSGFVIDMPMNLTGAKGRLAELHAWNWLDFRTRAVIVELTTLNLNVNVFVHTRLLFEFPATGGIVKKQEAFAFRALSMSLALMQTDDLSGAFLFLMLTCALMLMLLVNATWLIYKNGFEYFKFFWSWIDLFMLFLFFIYMMGNIDTYSASAVEPNLAPEVISDPEMFFPVGKLVPGMRTSANVMALLGLFSWLKIMKYFTLSHTFHGLVRVVERCLVNLLMFAFLLFIVLFGFAVSLHVGFGKDKDIFRSVWSSFVATIVAPAGGVDLSPIFDQDDLLGPVLILLYIMIVFLLLLNTFMAICVDTYTVLTYQMSEVFKRNSANPTMVFLKTYFSALKGVKLVGKETEEDKGAPEDQAIPLNALPEAIAIEYLKTKKRMEALLDNAEYQMQAEKDEQKRLRDLMDGLDPDESFQMDAPGGMMALQDNESNVLSVRPPPKEYPPPPEGGPPPDDLTGIIVNRVQLQRMLDDNPTLQEICSTTRAVEVMRRFRIDNSGIDPYEEVARLQAAVTKKLEELEKGGYNLMFNEMETLKTVSSELHAALTESQKEWRSELLTVLQMASLLSEALSRLTVKMEKVQVNHNSLALRAGPSGN